ncbi:sigma-54 dependent transcriptional regulator [Sorangium cellulosum]|uniref:Sigma-54 dependent transcriptional regulator n=1 Tax=Sorangium cellulosum TaxID=56 RepID=A0A4P2Q3A3_SORCE|nr:sigma 54-interacting transcriptional regulator [Sorangium cellulosum]AUX23794.1 sigma-54 dependent transcriptional regulator [Sorangium cellulosum]
MGTEHLQTTTRTMSAVSAPPAAGEGERPGLVVIWSEDRPTCLPLALGDEPLELGRQPSEGMTAIEDPSVSRRHTRITVEPQGIRVTDLGSRNGTFVDGERVLERLLAGPPRLLRLGHTLLRGVRDIRPFLRGGVEQGEGGVVGPTLRATREILARTAAAGDPLLITGPSGAGKELAARAYHAATGRRGPFVAVNCAAIPSALAERLFFGARRGAYSGAAADADGYIQAADTGTLFLDEIAELDLLVQPKLLRVIETREVLELGASRPRKVDIRLCAATLKDLPAEAAAGRFREDLYFRIGRPELRLPPLCERVEEIPYLACAELRRVDARLAPSSLLLEACALRAWPGNVRELLLALREAARAALVAGRLTVEPHDLPSSAGQGVARGAAAARPGARLTLQRDAVEAALREQRGNVTGAARALGVHRTQLRRWLSRHVVDPRTFDDEHGEARATGPCD